MSDAEELAALRRMAELEDKAGGSTAPVATPTPVLQSRGLTQDVLRSLGLAARAGITGAAGSAFYGIPMAGADAIANAINFIPGMHLKPTSQLLQDVMTAVGLPKPEGTGENIGQGLATLVAGTGGLGNATMNKTLGFLPAKAPDIVKQQTRDQAIATGIKLPPTQAEAGIGSRMLEGLGGGARVNESAKFSNETVVQDLTRKALGLPADTPITESVLRNLKNAHYDAGYKPISGAGTMMNGGTYRKSLDSLVKQYENSSFPAAAKQEIANEVSKYRVRSFDAGHAMEQIKNLRADASSNFASRTNVPLAKTQLGIADALENSIELNLQAKGKNGADLLDAFRQARKGIAMTSAVERTLKAGTGSPNAPAMAALMNKGAPLTDELALIAKTTNAFPKAMALPVGGKPSPVQWPDYLMGSLAGGGVAAGLGPLSGALGLYPLLRGGAREAILSNPWQQGLIKGAGSMPFLQQPAVQNALPDLYQLWNQE